MSAISHRMAHPLFAALRVSDALNNQAFETPFRCRFLP
jgi:hypothetical protein